MYTQQNETKQDKPLEEGDSQAQTQLVCRTKVKGMSLPRLERNQSKLEIES